jgi:hypothetical protein
MAFVNHPVEELEKSLRDYASPRCEEIKVQESDSKLEVTKYEIKSKIIEMVAATPFDGMATENPYRHIRHFTTLCNTVRQVGVPMNGSNGNSLPTHLPMKQRRGTHLCPLKLRQLEQVDKKVLREVFSN